MNASIAGATAELYGCDNSGTPIGNAVQSGTVPASWAVSPPSVGTYYAVASMANLATNLCNPFTGDLTEFADTAVLSSLPLAYYLDFNITHAGGTRRPIQFSRTTGNHRRRHMAKRMGSTLQMRFMVCLQGSESAGATGRRLGCRRPRAQADGDDPHG